MRINIINDNELLEEAMKLSNTKTKKEAVQLALEEFVANNKMKNLFELKGMIVFDEGYDYKAHREV